MNYSCVYETNPLLPRRPTTRDLLEHKALWLSWIPAVQNAGYPDWIWRPANTMMKGVITNNLLVLENVKNNPNCKKN